jgi:FMN phosphatase YigB (HAD superfamily)
LIDGVSHIFFALYGVLIDPLKVKRQYPSAVAAVLSMHYGETPALWESAFRRVLQDWDNYYADLDLAGENGVNNLWEGMYRTTRAIFRLASQPEPPRSELMALSRQLPQFASARCQASYSDVRKLVKTFKRNGMSLAVFAPMSAGQISGLLLGGEILNCFDRIIGFDTVERFNYDADYWKLAVIKAKAATEKCLVVAAELDTLTDARSIGMKTALIDQSYAIDPDLASHQSTLAVLAESILLVRSC